MPCFLVGARKESLHVHTATKILSICGWNMGGSTVTWDIDVSCPRTIHGTTTRSASTTRSKLGRHQYHWLVHRYLSSLKVLNKWNLERRQHKKRKRDEDKRWHNWRKKSIFFELPYWSSLLIRHNLDVKHIEKNICESILGTPLELEGKCKDGEKARLDMEHLRIRRGKCKSVCISIWSEDAWWGFLQYKKMCWRKVM